MSLFREAVVLVRMTKINTELARKILRQVRDKQRGRAMAEFDAEAARKLAWEMDEESKAAEGARVLMSACNEIEALRAKLDEEKSEHKANCKEYDRMLEVERARLAEQNRLFEREYLRRIEAELELSNAQKRHELFKASLGFRHDEIDALKARLKEAEKVISAAKSLMSEEDALMAVTHYTCLHILAAAIRDYDGIMAEGGG